MRFGGFDEALLDGASQIVASPGVSLKEPFLMSAAVRGIPIVGDIELFVREAQAPIAAHHRHEWQEHGHDARWPHGERRGSAGYHGRQSWAAGARVAR